MEWVETTGKTLEEAKGAALDQLGVAEDEAEFEILEEPKSGLFGRVRGEARVRARVRPAQARAKQERRRKPAERVASNGDGGVGPATKAPDAHADADATGSPTKDRGGAGAGSRAPRDRGRERPRRDRDAAPAEASVHAEQVGQEAVRFMKGLVAAFGADAEVELRGEGNDLEVRVQGSDIGLLVGPRGTTLQAVQDLARVASQRRLGDHDTRLRVDIGGYRERRQEALGVFARKLAEDVVASGTARVLEPMGSADRKAIHDALSDVEGIATRSEGEDPYRRVVIAPV